jgi:hypothetical protein
MQGCVNKLKKDSTVFYDGFYNKALKDVKENV